MSNISYRTANVEDLQKLTQIALLLYDEHTYDEISEEMSELLASGIAVCFLAEDAEEIIGFAQCSLRNDYVEGTHGGTIGYLEGIYVMPEYRKHGIAKRLLSACERWAGEKGCLEFASDCQLDNTDSYNFHLRVGFKEVNKMICFAKKLGSTEVLHAERKDIK